jgi:signal transduction histidine kinase
VVTEFDPDVPPVSCYPGELNQVFLNLLVNAAHAIGDCKDEEGGRKGMITVRTRRLPGWAEVRVADTGCGIPPEARGRVFDPFFTTKPVGKGTGQGLAIAHAVVVKKHGGRIGFESEVGKGTTFIVHLPVDGQHPEGGDS